MVFEIRPDPLLTCPLDESHRILESRMQFHLVRCSKNHKLGMRLKCPWNPLHIIDKFAYEDHYKRDCKDMPGAVGTMCPMEESRDVGSVPVTATNGLLPPGEEDWDAEPGNVGTYDPTKNAEGKPVLRIAIGLSKAKKKAYRQAERKRFQELEEQGPIQTPVRRPGSPERTNDLRAPFTMSKNLSTNTSMIEDLNSSKFSENNRNSRQEKKLHPELRAPYEQSSTLSYKPDVLTGANNISRNNISCEDEACALDEVPKLCQSFNNTLNDTMSIRSTTCTYDPNEKLRKTRENCWKIPNLNDSQAVFSEAEKSIYFDEPTCVPNLVGPDAGPENDNISELSQHFTELTTMNKKIDKTAAHNIQQMKMYKSELPKLVSSTATLNLLDGTYDDEITDNDISLNEKQRQFLNGLSKCAANFPNRTKNADSTKVGHGRGMIMASDMFKENRPGPTPEEIIVGINNIGRYPSRVSTNPFDLPEQEFVGNISRQTLSTANADDDDSEYEKAD